MAVDGFGNLIGGTIEQAIGFGAGTALGAALEPAAQGIRNEIWPHDPNVPVPPADLAAMAVQGVMAEHEAAAEALLSGINGERFHRLFLVNGNPIAPEEALDLWNRGEIDENDVARALLQSRLKPEWVDTFKKLKRTILQAADLANMVVQNVITEDEGFRGASHLGIERDDFHRMVRLAGNPIAPMEALDLWNRGKIDEPAVTRALLQSRLKPEWVDTFKELRFHPPSAAQAVLGVVRERIPYEEGQRIAHENGLSAEDFHLLVNTAGRAISITEALALYNRGEYTAEQVRHVVAFSDIRTEFTDDILKLRVRYPSLFQIRTLITNGSVTDDQAMGLLTDQGYAHWLAEAIVNAAHAGKTQAEKDLTKNEIVTLYHGGGVSRDDAAQMLQDLGYDATEADYILSLADFRRTTKFIEAVINKVHSAFVNRKIDETAVATELDGIGVPQDQREQLIDLWTEERAANIRLLSVPQIEKALAQQRITRDEAHTKLMQLGYAADDADLLLPAP